VTAWDEWGAAAARDRAKTEKTLLLVNTVLLCFLLLADRQQNDWERERFGHPD
jgi:hypothetical protein